MGGENMFSGAAQDLTFFIARQEVKTTSLRPIKEWAEIVATVNPIHEMLLSVDHYLLEEKLRCGGAAVEELKQTVKLERFTSENGGKASRGIKLVIEWLEVSVAPLL